MKYSIATVSLSGTLEQKIKAIASEGYDGLELFENDLTISELSPADIGLMAKDNGLEIIALQPFRDFEGMPEPRRTKNLDRAERKFDLMEQLGTRKLLICSNVSAHAIDDATIAAEDLYCIAEQAAKRGFTVGYEALAWGRFVNDYRQTIDIVRKAKHPNLGVVLDSYHILVKDTPLDAISTLNSDEIALVQVADAPKLDMGAMHLSRHYRSFPGQGSLPVVDFMKAIRSTGYNDYVSQEIFSDEFRSSLTTPTASDGLRSLRWLDHISQPALQTRSQTPKPASSDAVAKIEFIEFASDTQAETELIQLLTNLGFVERFRHKSKSASLYQLGDANIIINRQRASHAYQYYLEHGVGVCAIGLKVKNQNAMMQWAECLNYTRFAANADAGELQIPAVRGPNDTLYYFIEDNKTQHRFYDTDFNPTQINATANSIQGIDHIGQALRSDDLLSATLFYRAFLGFDIEESVDLLDPYGIVYSRVARNKRGNIRIPMNSTHSWGTSSQRFIKLAHGGGIQQIALLSSDVFSSAKSINQKFILNIPSNYYADLSTRCDLDKATIKTMETMNILYDRDENGEFFHFYIKELNGLFFEIVQRIENYQRYGEVNSQVRLIAQMRENNR
ncbi:MAG: sugar phosphate isomerase/epimerase and 4-hydroxyphenylpyruvate domain-containing protein [Spongiibacteraceae bacterium]|nr:sugar phosphate isomerase/epimerase and 4-hydroxyphenylpyruvate domain-containing protein [Spongiibacteraceae bacterium]MBN4055552.1 sugar phosphate isomerase/epimerase and 4-hydroxyphenylpyruvate domain-containing protein [bacterium AH-315-K03]